VISIPDPQHCLRQSATVIFLNPQNTNLGKLLLDVVVSTLYEHIVQARPPEYVGVGRGVAEGVNSPPAVGLVALQVLVAPLVTFR
jgi:hypothetical protein